VVFLASCLHEEEVLHEKGIRIITNSPVSQVENANGDSNDICLSDDAKSKIHSSLIIWTAGIKGYNIPINPEVEKTKDGRIILNEFCQIDRYPNIFSVGFQILYQSTLLLMMIMAQPIYQSMKNLNIVLRYN
jgi:NADH dehydrogenase FAD-containing subunit